MKMTHAIGKDYRGCDVPIYVFECDKSERDAPKNAKFEFGVRGGISEPKWKWTTREAANARKLAQYADEHARRALIAAGVRDFGQAVKNAQKREKALRSREINALLEMPEEERRRQIHLYLGFAEKDARECGYVSASCTSKLYKLRAFEDRGAKDRYEAANGPPAWSGPGGRQRRTCRLISEKSGHFWYEKGEQAVHRAAAVLEQDGEGGEASELQDRLADLHRLHRERSARSHPAGASQTPETTGRIFFKNNFCQTAEVPAWREYGTKTLTSA